MKTCLLLPGLLAARAQQAPTPAAAATTTGAATTYQVQHDSLLARAERVRASVAARTQSVETSFKALFGTRRVIVSMGSPGAAPSTGQIPLSRNLPLKKEVVKHKTHGAIVHKVAYGSGSTPQLYEYYEDGNLVQLVLNNYPLRTGSGNNTFVTMRWLRGNYLSVSQRTSANAGGA